MPNAHTRANILETKEGFQLELLAPGYAKDELKLNVEKDILTLSADPKQSEMPEGNAIRAANSRCLR
ncbi:MAG: Hsp20/alpha crystallin family protein [Flavobacteriales bacterium]|nr:Hsp20/alpha crystallin family protein [Flavobacteriales bacterium]